MHAALQSLRARRARGEDNGFTLIELLVVVVIIGILIAIAVPLYLNYQKGAHNKAAESDVRNAIAVLEQCYSDNGTYPASFADDNSTGSTPTATACTGRNVNTSNGTKLTVTVTGNTYTIVGVATTGDMTYTYQSGNGGAPVGAKTTTP